MSEDKPVVVSTNDMGATWRAYEVADEADDNLDEIMRRYRQKQKLLLGLGLIGPIVTALISLGYLLLRFWGIV